MNMVCPGSFGVRRWGCALIYTLVTHFSMWALLKSPLVMGHDLLGMVCFVSKVNKIAHDIHVEFTPSVR